LIPSICEKIQQTINEGITQESQVVYLLTCIRKVLEQEESNNAPDPIKFYCDWALHTKLEGPPAQKVLSYFNSAHTALQRDEKTLPNEVQDISKFTGLVLGIKKFLQNHSITLFEYSSSDWAKFIFLYASIIEDCPLVIKSKNIQQANIKKVTVSVEFADEVESGQQYYKVRWVITDSADQDAELYIINSFDA
jgi:hypothetical protein